MIVRISDSLTKPDFKLCSFYSVFFPAVSADEMIYVDVMSKTAQKHQERDSTTHFSKIHHCSWRRARACRGMLHVAIKF